MTLTPERRRLAKLLPELYREYHMKVAEAQYEIDRVLTLRAIIDAIVHAPDPPTWLDSSDADDEPRASQGRSPQSAQPKAGGG